MRVAGQTPSPITGRLVLELKTKGQDEGEDTFEERLAIAKQLKVGRFVLKINSESPVFGKVSANPVTLSYKTSTFQKNLL